MSQHKIISAGRLQAGDSFTHTNAEGQTSYPLFIDWAIELCISGKGCEVELGVIDQSRNVFWITLPSSEPVTIGLTNRWAKRMRAQHRKLRASRG